MQKIGLLAIVVAGLLVSALYAAGRITPGHASPTTGVHRTGAVGGADAPVSGGEKLQRVKASGQADDFAADWDTEASGQSSRIPFASLPLALAIRTVKGNGTRKMAVFTDPMCAYCHQLAAALKPVTNVTIYTFLLPLDPADAASARKAAAIWCSRHPSSALSAWMLKGVNPPVPGTCATPLARIRKLAQPFRIRLTPTMVFNNGQRVAGALTTKDIESLLDASSKS